ncbi:MAG: helix-turn-helix transcriptional regulator [Firmicutes bacterium]|nr:helix-turn-helix transcriptional regulator [Bacillota bacterium]
MKSFSDKIKDARASLGLSQTEIAQATGVSVRSIAAYENGEKTPRQGTMLKLAKALQVSVTFLTDDSCEDPMADIDKDGYIAEAREHYGASGARDMQQLMQDNAAFFAGGSVSQEEKDMLFESLTKAYFACREAAKEKFGRKES